MRIITKLCRPIKGELTVDAFRTTRDVWLFTHSQANRLPSPIL